MMDAGRDRPPLRHATAADARPIAALHARLFSPAWDETTWHTLLSDLTSHAYCIGDEAAGRVDAFLIARVAADEAEILSLGVSPHCQRQGHAARLVAAFVEWARRRGVKGIYLEVAEDNAAARTLYARAGFAVVGRRRGYYAITDAPSRDALVLNLEL